MANVYRVSAEIDLSGKEDIVYLHGTSEGAWFDLGLYLEVLNVAMRHAAKEKNMTVTQITDYCKDYIQKMGESELEINRET